LSATARRHYRSNVRNEAVRFLRDTFYVGVGFGVLAVQKAQVRRRELERTLDEQLAGPREQLGRVFGHTANGDRADTSR
jgi:hypothetical protein